MSTSKAAYISSDVARSRILEAARELLAERPYSALTVGLVMSRAGLARTVFYRHFEDLPALAPHLLPDADEPLVGRIERAGADDPRATVEAMVEGLVGVYAEHGRLLRAIDDAARQDPAVADQLDAALVAPRRLLARLLRAAPHPPPHPEESARMLMAAHRAYLLDVFGAGDASSRAPGRARAALTSLWEQLLA